MSDQSAPSTPSAGSESGTAEAATTGSTSNSPSDPSGQPSGTPAAAPSGAQASQIVEAISNAEQTPDGKFELVIDGEKVILTLEEMKAGYQKAAASAKRFQAAAAKEKAAAEKEAAVEARRQQLLRNPLKAMYEEGVDPEAVRRHYEEAVWQWLEQDKMTPEQKAEIKAKQEHESEKQRIAREKAEIEQWKAERQAEKDAKEVEKYQNEYAAQLSTALSKHNLPQSPRVVAQLVEYMKEGLSYDDTFTFDDAAQAYKEENMGSIEEYLKSLSPAQLLERLGPEGVKAFRAHDVAANVKNPTPAPKKPTAQQPKAKDSKVSSKDFFANLGKR